MNRNELLQKVEEVCRDIFEDDQLTVSEETSAADIEGWDSLTHLSLISELEEVFDIAFTLDETTGSKKLGDLISAIERHIGGKEVR